MLFLDEVDALGQKRSQLRNSALRKVVNQLLAELDDVSGNNEGVFVLGATNHPWDVDTALRRPGRFDRTLLVLPPDQPAREAILSCTCASGRSPASTRARSPRRPMATPAPTSRTSARPRPSGPCSTRPAPAPSG